MRFDSTIASTEQNINYEGFKRTGATRGSNTDVTRSEGFIYMPNVGIVPYSDEEKNVTTIDNYSFVNRNGNTFDYSVAYELKQSYDKILFVENVRIIGCSTSNPDLYESLCGNNSPINQINHIDKTDEVKVFDSTKTWITVIFSLVGLVIAEILILENM